MEEHDMADGSSETLTQVAGGYPELERPFQDVLLAPADVSVSTEAPAAVPSLAETPFTSEYMINGEVVDTELPEFKRLLFELYEAEFDHAVQELADEADAKAEQFQGTGSVDTFLQEWVEPLAAGAEGMLASMAEALAERDPLALSEQQLEELLDSFEPSPGELGQPAFDHFFGKIWKKAKSAVKGAVALARKGIAAVGKFLPIGMLLQRLKRLVRPLLQRVLKFALNKLPPALRPVAGRLAGKLLKERADTMEGLDELSASPDVAEIQQEFDAAIGSLLFASNEIEQELVVSDALLESEQDPGVEVLDRARSRLVAELTEGQRDPAEMLEGFIPAVLPLVRLGIRVMGRPRVVNLLARLLGKLIGPYVGESMRPVLSKAIADAGLRLLTLEVSAEEEDRVAAEAIASAVEDTVVKLATLDEEALTDDRLLEAAAIEAFREAAAANFPPSLLVPEVRETENQTGTWVSMPVRDHRKRYRKYTRAFNVVITPTAARSITTFGGRPLAAVLPPSARNQTVRGRLHLYQAVQGTSLGRIARREGRSTQPAGARGIRREQLYPFTPEAAATLVQEPGLGRSVSEAFLASPDRVAVGQRFYFLELPSAEAASRPSPDAAGAATDRPSQAGVTMDFPKSEIRVHLYFSEADAQETAACLRKKQPVGAVLAKVQRLFGTAIGRALSGHDRRLVKVIHEALSQDEFVGPGLRRLRSAVRARLGRRLHLWVTRALADLFEKRAGEFTTAAEDPAPGVSVVVTLSAPPGLPALRRMFAEAAAAEALAENFAGAPGGVKVEVSPGLRA
jgi:hypothetical protein